MIHVAAVGDLHFGLDSAGFYRPRLERIADEVSLLLLAGDLTRHGDPHEALVAAAELRDLGVPVVAVLGNHDYHQSAQDEVSSILGDAGVRVIECESVHLTIDGLRVGISGSKGFGGGFVGACASEFGEPEMKAFVRHTIDIAERLEKAAMETAGDDVRIVLLHYSPCEQTLRGERLEIWPFMGSYLLGEAIDHAGADLVVHGHAHRGQHVGITAGGVPVRNVAQPVIGAAYTVYCFDRSGPARCAPAESTA